MDNYLLICPEVKRVVEALKDSDFLEDRSVAKYLQSKLDEMLDDSYTNWFNLADRDDPLTEAERKVMALRYFNGLTPKEISMRTGLNQQYVRNVCTRVTKKYVIGQHEFWTAGGALE